MSTWKEQHYARAVEFVQLLARAITSPPAQGIHASASSAPRPLTAPPALKPAAPTAAAVFKAIPWKK